MSEQDIKAMRRAEQVRQLLDNPVHEEAWDAIRARLLVLLETAQSDEATLKTKMALNLLTDVRAHWLRIVNDGSVAAQSIKMEEEKRRWFTRAA